MAVLSTATGCSRPDRSEAAARARPPPLSLEQFPTGRMLAITSVDCRLQAGQTVRIMAPGTGRLHLLVPPEKHEVGKGELWAVFDAETLEAGSGVLAARRAALEERRKRLLEIEIPRHRMELENQLAETRRWHDIARRIGHDEEVRRGMAEFLPPAGMPDLADLTGYERREDLLGLELASVDATANRELAVAEAELKQGEIELAAKKALHEFRAPFAGELVWNLASARSEQDYQVTAGELVAVIRETDAIEGEVRMQDSRWLVLPTESLRLALPSPSGRKVLAPFCRSRLREEQQRDAIYYSFRIPPEEGGEFKTSGEALLPGEILEVLPREARMVPKLELLRAYPDAFGRADWTGGVQRIWPGAQVEALGNALVAILAPPDRK